VLPTDVLALAMAVITAWNVTLDAVEAVPRRPAVAVVRRNFAADADAATRARKPVPMTRAQKKSCATITFSGANPTGRPAAACAEVISFARYVLRIAYAFGARVEAIAAEVEAA
jgi:hypothetical protein